MSIQIIILCTSLGNLFFKSTGLRYFKASFYKTNLLIFFLNLDFIYLRVPEFITTNNHFSYKISST